MRFKDRLEYAAVRSAQALICLLPAGVSGALGAGLGDVAFSVFRLRRDVVMGHLRRVFGNERTEADLVRLARRCYRNTGRTLFEYARFPRMSTTEIGSNVTLTGRTHLDEALAGGKGAILVAGHFGNWEMFAVLALAGYPVTFLVGEQHNLLVDGLMNRLRARFGVEIVPLTGSLTGVFRALSRNRVVAMLSDQDAGKRGMFVDFLGLEASTPYGPGRFAASTGAPLLPGMVVRRGASRHEIVVCPPVNAADGGEPAEERARLYTQAYTRALEDYVRRYPDQYFWMHRRWKTRPQSS